jgi:aryl-alcohol dehydrogenase-like predicted oxidoreductase
MSAFAGLSYQARERKAFGLARLPFRALFFAGGLLLIGCSSRPQEQRFYQSPPVASSTLAGAHRTAATKATKMSESKLPCPALGASGLKVPRLWLGAMMFGDRTDAAEAARMVAAARDAGVFALDTADAYAGGESERITGKLIGGDRSHWVLATKLANQMGPGPNDRGLSRRHMLGAVRASLQRLGTDWVDLLYLHRDDDGTPQEETLSTVAELIRSGQVRYWGVSNFRAWRVARLVQLARAMGVPPPIASQSPYNAMSRGIETELLPCCADFGIGVVAYSPLARGVLSGKYAPDEPPPDGSRAARNDKRIMQTEFRRESVLLAQRAAAYAERRGVSLTQLTLGWVWNNRLVHGLIGGPRTLEQWQDYLQAIGQPFSADDEAFFDALVPAGHASTPGYTDPQYPVTGRVSAAG